MSYKYALFHTSVHVLLALAIYFVFQLNAFNFFVMLLGTALIDLDHIPLLFRKGMMGYLYIRTVIEFRKPRKYFLHNLVVLPTFLICSILAFYQQYFVFGIFSLGAASHLIWDFFEDVVIFKMGIKHWKI